MDKETKTYFLLIPATMFVIVLKSFFVTLIMLVVVGYLVKRFWQDQFDYHIYTKCGAGLLTLAAVEALVPGFIAYILSGGITFE